MVSKEFEKEILSLFDKWNEAVMAGNPENVAKLYAEEVVFLPTLSKVIRTDYDGVRDYFVTFCALPKIRGKIDDYYIRNFGDTAVNSGNYTFYFEKDGSPFEVKARYTYIYRKQNEEWKIAEHHSSIQPEG